VERHEERSMHRRLIVAAVVLLLAALQPGTVLGEDPPSGPESGEERPLELTAVPVQSIPAGATRSGDPYSGDYRIGKHDLLEIRVFDLEELDQTVRVSSDGSISVPLLGKLDVAGLTKTELESLIAGLLEERYVRNPQVIVFVKEYESKKVAVSGTVKEPGTFEMLGQKTLLEMISLAGGLDKDFGKEIIIFREGEDGTTNRIAVDLERLVYLADPSLNIVLVPGDIVYVPAIEKIRIFVSGAVKDPNLYEVPRSEPVTVLKAVTLAGGTTDRAAEKKVQILRTDENGERVVLEVNLKKIKRGKIEDPILEEDDVVFVPESFF
jgi:polysaccharide export outer membrane protein